MPDRPAKPRKKPAKSGGARQRTLTDPTSRPGPKPLILRGFTYTAPTDPASSGAWNWTPKTPAAEVLAALAIGATWEHAASFALLHHATPRAWNARGEAALGDHPDLDHLAASGADPELVAYAAFHVAANDARSAPVVGALESIDRARRGGDWKAGAHVLKVLPQARDYRETSRHEVTGEDGEPVRVAATLGAEQAILDLAERIAAETTDDDT